MDAMAHVNNTVYFRYMEQARIEWLAWLDQRCGGFPGQGSVIVNVASMSAYMLPAEMIPTEQFPLAVQDADAFMDAMMTACNVAPENMRSGISYALSKGFVKWYSQSQSERFNARGMRIVSVSPGSVDTEMGRLEEQAGAGAIVAHEDDVDNG